MTPERLAEFIPSVLEKLSPPAMNHYAGRPLALCRWLNQYTTESQPVEPPEPLGDLWPRPPRIAANRYSLIGAPTLPALHTLDSGPVQFCNRPGADKAGKYLPALEKCQRVADHVIACNGEVAFARTDFALPGPIPFKWRRVYCHHSADNTGLGSGWRHTLSEQLRIADGNAEGAGQQGNGIELQTVDGRVISFALPPIGHSCYNRFERLLLHRQSLHSYRLCGFDQPDRIFRADGTSSAMPLAEIRDHFGNSLTIDYQQGLPHKIVSSWGRVIDFEYSGEKIQGILNQHAPADKQDLCNYQYERETGQLCRASGDTLEEHYRYEGERIAGIANGRAGSIEFFYDSLQRCHAIQQNNLHLKLSWRRSQGHCTLNSAGRYPTDWKFNQFGQLLRETQQERSTTYLYDHYGNLCQTTAADDQRNIYRYDEFGRLLRHSANGISDRYLYSEMGFLVAAQLLGEQTWRFSFCEKGLPQEITDPAGQHWNLRYNDRGQLLQIVDPENGKIDLVWDSQGQLLSVQRGARQWEFEYDYWQRLSASKLAGEILHRWRYGRSGELQESQIGADRLELASDSQNRTGVLKRNGQTALQWQTDEAGNICQIRMAAGRNWRIEYDAHNRLVEAHTRGETRRWHYDLFGQRTEFSGAHGDRRQWRYDIGGRLLEYRDNDTHWYYHYTETGALRQIRNNSGQQCEFHFDSHGRLLQADNSHSSVRFQYDPRNLLVAEHHHGGDTDGLSINHKYDSRGWLKKSTSDNLDIHYLLAPDGSLYGVDANGEAAMRCEVLAQCEEWTQGRAQSRLQFQQGQLTGVKFQDELKWQFESSAALPFTEPPSVSKGAADTVEHDMRGNIARELRAGRQQREYFYQFDGWGLLTSAECGDFKTYFRYDPFGRRLSKLATHRKSTRRRRINYRWHSAGLWSEGSVVNDSVQPTTHYLYHPVRGTLLSRWEADTLEHYLVAPSGAPLALLDHQGELLWREESPATEGGPPGRRQKNGCGPWRGAGQIADSETGLYYSLQGYWHPLLACWLHRDDSPIACATEVETVENSEMPAVEAEPA